MRGEEKYLAAGCFAMLIPFAIWATVWGGIIWTAVHFIRKFW